MTMENKIQSPATTPEIETWNGREIETKQVFKEQGTFESLYKANEWANANGYSVGSSARDLPKGLRKKDCNIPKWYNLDKKEIDELDGVMISKDFREGEVEILIFKK